jgi:hypothetical protein
LSDPNVRSAANLVLVGWPLLSLPWAPPRPAWFEFPLIIRRAVEDEFDAWLGRGAL